MREGGLGEKYKKIAVSFPPGPCVSCSPSRTLTSSDMFAFPLAAVLLGAIPSLTSATSLGFESAKGYAQCARALTQRSCHSSYSIPADSAGTCCYNGALQMGGKESGLALQTQFW